MDSAIPVVKMGAFNPACSAGIDPMASSNFFGSCHLYNICTHTYWVFHRIFFVTACTTAGIVAPIFSAEF